MRPISISQLAYIFKLEFNMSFFRVLLSIICPPLAVIDKGCGSVFIVLILTIFAWIPGVLGALIILNNPKR